MYNGGGFVVYQALKKKKMKTSCVTYGGKNKGNLVSWMCENVEWLFLAGLGEFKKKTYICVLILV